MDSDCQAVAATHTIAKDARIWALELHPYVIKSFYVVGDTVDSFFSMAHFLSFSYPRLFVDPGLQYGYRLLPAYLP